jgi:glycosyltransferase involved in cell wall biosynthesis
MKFSLILSTLNRSEEVAAFLGSLLNQTYKNFEVIIIDQNEDEKVYEIFNKFKDKLDIKYIHSKEKGLSLSRNLGLKAISGDVIAFPDDDCLYNKDVLEIALKNFETNQVNILSGKLVPNVEEFQKKPSNIQTSVNRFNIWFKCISATIFLEKKVFEKVGYFDEDLGVGSGTKYSSGEETDYLLRAIANGFDIKYIEDIKIFHEEFNIDSSDLSKKAYDYSYGRMHVIKRHNYGLMFILINLFYPLVKLILRSKCKKRRVSYYWNQFKGRFDYLFIKV